MPCTIRYSNNSPLQPLNSTIRASRPFSNSHFLLCSLFWSPLLRVLHTWHLRTLRYVPNIIGSVLFGCSWSWFDFREFSDFISFFNQFLYSGALPPTALGFHILLSAKSQIEIKTKRVTQTQNRARQSSDRHRYPPPPLVAPSREIVGNSIS